ncbi:glutamate-5-semialdehyde dehydrogenase [Streptomyces candidus]|uniref:Gamma-glutamyl phosphate reductase n=1 Tax=Streptomyces candidus TaxID=67283 RepID=A0A7X0HJ57_9ACTN|nr:glutamate-5-semialdehyde dehydrogenase [Streptomyces candidus]MBB6438625.1 glutamate-5-semialdehyde dehydrogenase [Streptomyces candidus]GHH45273.1 gamma-glutamyl phosphate reductase [Streptomyces candidus]
MPDERSVPDERAVPDASTVPDELLARARAAHTAAPPLGDPAYDRYCAALAGQLLAHWPQITAANATDVEEAGRAGMPPTLVDRIRLTDAHRDGMVALAERTRRELATVTDVEVPVSGAARAVHRVPRPLGLVMMVYEARPTVTVDGALLPVAVGNAVLLRGGKETAATNAALQRALHDALTDAGLPPGLVTVLDDPHRRLLRALLKRPDQVDVLIPRGSPALVDYCRTSAIPLIASGGGANHLYVHHSADLGLAARVTLDSKLPEPAGCTSVETVLVDRAVAAPYVEALAQELKEADATLTVRTEPGTTIPVSPGLRAEPLAPHDLGREFLGPVVALVAVDGVAEALEHVRAHGSGHTEGVLADDADVVEAFRRRVDAAMVVVNGSLRLHDGPTLGLGSEIAIATGRLHVRGPVTLASLVTYGYVTDAAGALRG